WSPRVGQGVADSDVGYARERDDVADLGDVAGNTREARIAIDRDDFEGSSLLAGPVQSNDAVAWAHRAASNTANSKTSLVAVVVKCGDLDLERGFGLALRRRDVVQDRFEQGLEIVGKPIGIEPGFAFAGDGIQHWE